MQHSHFLNTAAGSVVVPSSSSSLSCCLCRPTAAGLYLWLLPPHDLPICPSLSDAQLPKVSWQSFLKCSRQFQNVIMWLMYFIASPYGQQKVHCIFEILTILVVIIIITKKKKTLTLHAKPTYHTDLWPYLVISCSNYWLQYRKHTTIFMWP